MLVADLCLVSGVFGLKDKRHIEQLKGSLEHFRFAATETGEHLRNVENEVGVTAFGSAERVLKLVKFLLEHLGVVLTRQQVEAVDAECFDVGPVLEDNLSNTFHSVVPLAVLDMDLALLDEHWREVGVENADFGKCGKTVVIALGLF